MSLDPKLYPNGRTQRIAYLIFSGRWWWVFPWCWILKSFFLVVFFPCAIIRSVFAVLDVALEYLQDLSIKIGSMPAPEIIVLNAILPKNWNEKLSAWIREGMKP